MENISNVMQTQGKAHQMAAWLLLAGLLILRLPFLTGITLFSSPEWLDPVFEIGTYFLTACLIWWERERLAHFHIDGLALGIIILFKPVQTLYLTIVWNFNSNPLAFPNWPGLFLWGISLGLVAALWLSRAPWPKLSRKSWIWFGAGILAGLLTVLLMAYPMSLQVNNGSDCVSSQMLTVLRRALPAFFYQLGYAAVSEEPLFRGFLWGYLRLAGWKNRWICLLQASLFMLGHSFYIIRAPISFWLIVPFGAIVFGGLVWRTKSLSSSLAAHGISNALGYAVGCIVAGLRV